MRVHNITAKNKIFRLTWKLTWLFLAAWTPVFMHRWRVLLVRLFGGNVCFSSCIYPSTTIWNPKNIVMGTKSTLGPYVDCYNVALVSIGNYATVSQRTYLCTASHDYDQPVVTDNIMNLLIGPIVVEDFAWIAAEVFVGPDKIIRNGSIILAGSVVTKSTTPMGVYGGNPVKHLKDRKSILKVSQF